MTRLGWGLLAAMFLLACATVGERAAIKPGPQTPEPRTSLAEDWRGAELTGILMGRDGHPVAGGLVYAYPPGGSILGPAQAMSDPSTAEGGYSLVLPYGRYAIVARKRLSGAPGGPLRSGDLFGRLDSAVSLDAPAAKARDIVLDTFTQGQEGDPRKVLATGTRITGVILGADQKPVEGAHAFAYLDRAEKDAPDWLSSPSGPEGGFALSLPRAGAYVIGARTGLRGRPRPGDLIGYWGDRDTVHRVEDAGQIDGVVIRLAPYRPGTTPPAAGGGDEGAGP